MEQITTKLNFRTCRTAELWSDDDEISWLVFLPDSEVEEDDASEIIRTAEQTFVGEAFVVLADIRLMKSISNEARTYFASQQGEQLHAAVALLVDSMATRLIANFFINFHKPGRPTRIFTDERKAVEWLKKYLPPKT